MSGPAGEGDRQQPRPVLDGPAPDDTPRLLDDGTVFPPVTPDPPPPPGYHSPLDDHPALR